MVALACVLFTAVLAAYVFFPERTVAAQKEKTRLEYLRERKLAIEDNLRDLRFEHRAGKYRDEEFSLEEEALEREAVEVALEMDALEAPEVRAVR